MYLGIKAPETLSAQQDHQAAEVAGARLSEHARPDVHLRRIGNVDRTRGAQGERWKSASKASTWPRNCRLLAAEMSYLAGSADARSRTSTPAPAWNRFVQLTHRLDPVRALRHAARRALRVLSQESRDQRMNAGRKEGGGAAADPDGADDPVLSAGPVRRHSHAGGHSDQSLELIGRAPGIVDFRCAEAARRRMIRHAPRDFPIVVASRRRSDRRPKRRVPPRRAEPFGAAPRPAPGRAISRA